MTTNTNTPIDGKNDKTWQELVRATFVGGSGTDGYKNFMRRSLQAIVLYEALRCCKDSFPTLRPFQRKIALLDMAKALVGTLDFLDAEQQAQVLWRTNSSQELMGEHNCWNRRKMLLQEMEKINKDMKVLLAGCQKTQEEALQEYLQQKYDEVSDDKQQQKEGTAPPANFFFNHNHVLPCYMMYYLSGDVNPGLPMPNPPKTVLVVAKKPAHMMLENQKNKNRGQGGAGGGNMDREMAKLALKDDAAGYEAMEDASNDEEDDFEEEDWDVVTGDEDSPVANKKAPAAKGLPKTGKVVLKRDLFHLRHRMLMLQSIKYHMELLKEFEGVVPQEELDGRKRELYTRLCSMGAGVGMKNKAATKKVGGPKKVPGVKV